MTRETSNYIVIRDEHGNDLVWGGCVDFKSTWTWDPDKMRRVSAGLGIDLLRDFRDVDCGDGPRLVVGCSVLGPRIVQLGREGDFRTIVVGGV